MAEDTPAESQNGDNKTQAAEEANKNFLAQMSDSKNQDGTTKAGTLTQQSTALSDIYENIVNFQFESGEEKEIINILNNYRWTINENTHASSTASGQIPFIYVAERQQLFSSQITNVINSIMSLSSAKEKVRASAENLTQVIANVSQAMADAFSGDGKAQSAKEDAPKNEAPKESTPAPSDKAESPQSGDAPAQPSSGTPTPADGKQATGTDGTPKAVPPAQPTAQPATTGTQPATSGTQPTASGSQPASTTPPAGTPTKDESLINKALNKADNVVSSMMDFLSKMGLNVNDIYKQSHLNNSSLLFPYLYLYATKPTGKFYIFPFLTDDAAKFHLTNSFSDNPNESNNQTSILSGAGMDVLQSVPRMLSGVINDVLQVSSLLSQDTTGRNFNNNWVEMGKFYNYNTNGDEITVKFPLFNTVKKDEWKKNHKFCFAFALRNMPFKIDNSSYKMPLLYDVMIPGVKRMPFAYVAELNIEPKGIVRPLIGENYLKSVVTKEKKENSISLVSNLFKKEQALENENSTQSYNIPEAWLVTIKFKDLVGESANKVLSMLAEQNISGTVEVKE